MVRGRGLRASSQPRVGSERPMICICLGQARARTLRMPFHAMLIYELPERQ